MEHKIPVLRKAVGVGGNFLQTFMQIIGNYRLDVFRDATFVKGSLDNLNRYDFEYFDQGDYVFPTMVGISVFEKDNLIKSAIIGSAGGGTGIYEGSVIYEEARILICCSDSIFCLSIPELSLLWRTQADQATCFEIYKFQDNYVVHGECEISRLDQNGRIIWQKSGADIFVTLDSNDSFELTDNFIIARDFRNHIYRLTMMAMI